MLGVGDLHVRVSMTAVILLSFVAPTAIADTTDHVACLGDTGAIGEREAGSGCADSWIETWVECQGAKYTYACDVWATVGIEVSGHDTCALTAADDAPLNVTENATACNVLADDAKGASDRHTEHMTRYTHDQIPDGGRSIVVNATVCVRPADDVATRSCETYHHVEHVPSPPTGETSIEGAVHGQVVFAKTTVIHAEPPVSVHP